MNKERIQELIDLMSVVNAKHFDIDSWAHECGSPSCVAGWATVLPSWKEGGTFHSGLPWFNDAAGVDAFAEWAGISLTDSQIICGVYGNASNQFYGVQDTFEEGKYVEDIVTPAHVVNALTQYLETADE